MAMMVPKAPGFAQMLKDGAKHYSGLDEAVYQNIEACLELAKTTRSAYGPNGLNKMVINHIEKLFVTNDAATILKELEVQHPAAKLLIMGSKQQEEECGDGTNFVIVFGGALLAKAEELLRMGLSVSDLVTGYELALKKVLEFLPSLVCCEIKDIKNREEVCKVIKCAVMSKQYGQEDFLSGLIVDACLPLLSESSSTFNVDNVRVTKIPGGGILNSSVVSGMVFTKQVESTKTKVEGAKIAVYSCPLDIMQTETSGTVLIKTAQELKNYSRGEEQQVEETVKAIADTGCNVIVTGGKVGELVMHYADLYKIMVVRLNSKFELRRLCRTVNATALSKIDTPSSTQFGHCDQVYIDEIGDTDVVIFKQVDSTSRISTIVIRGSTANMMDDVERAINDGVNTYKMLTKDPRLLPGAGAHEMELGRMLESFADTCPGLEQYAISKFAAAFETLPRALAENSGVKGNDLIAKLNAAHQKGEKNAGYDLASGKAEILDTAKNNLVDLFMSRFWAIKFATIAVITIIRVDQIIWAKQAGGPKPRDGRGMDDD